VHLTSYGPAAFLTHHSDWFECIVHPEDRARVKKIFRQNLFDTQRIELEYRILNRQGKVVWLRDHLNVMRLVIDTQEVLCLLGCLQNITEFRNNLKQLKLVRQQWNAIINTSEEGVWLLTLNGETIFVNQSMADMLGYSVAELSQSTFVHYLTAEYQAKINDYLTEARNHLLKRQQIAFQHKNGSILSTLLNMSLLEHSLDYPTAILVMVSDISPYKQLEVVIKKREIAFELLAKNFPFGILLVRSEHILYVNPVGAELLGRKVEELVYRNMSDLFDVTVIRKYTDLLYRDLYPPKASLIHEFRILSRGLPRWIEACFTRFEMEENPDILITLTDIHERRQTEDALRLVAYGSGSLSGTHFLDSLVEYLADTLNLDCVFIAELIVDEAHTQAMVTYISHPPKYFDYLSYNVLNNSSCNNLIKLKTMQLVSDNARKQYPNDDLLKRLTVEGFAGMPLLRANGEPLGLIMLTSCHKLQQSAKITALLQVFTVRIAAELERIQALEALRAEQASLAQRVAQRTQELEFANAELARASRMKDEFIAMMSHELRTPLNSILGTTEILQEYIYGPLTNKQVTALERVQHNSEHLLALINDILDFAKVEVGELALDIQPQVLNDLISECVQSVEKSITYKNLSLSISFNDQITTVFVDANRFKQILLNLLTNAVKFTPSNGTIKIVTQANLEQETVEIKVIDSGIGIAEDNFSHLFLPFEQLDRRLNRDYEGTGLGLSLVYRLLKLHNGSISVSSKLGVGSVFTITLPMTVNIEPINKGSLKLLNRSPKPMQHILIAEDDPYNAESLRDYLYSKQYQVTLSLDSGTVLNTINQVMPDLIIMDMQIPLIDHLSVLRKIRQTAKSKQIPIIILSALSIEGDRERCLNAGANAYYVKPISYHVLLKRIKKLLAINST
jgi:PAS domain S-box-containing protein